MSHQEEDVDREIDREFLLKRKIHKSVVDEELFVLQKNKVFYVANLLAFLSDDRLRSLKAKNERGEVVTLGEGTVATLWAYIVEERRKNSAPAEPKFVETFYTETDTFFDFVPPSEFDEALRLVEASMRASAPRDMNFVVCTGPMGVGKTRMGLELVKAAQKNGMPGWKCGYISSASLLPRFEAVASLEDLPSCFQVLSSALARAFLRDDAFGMVNITPQSVITKVKRDLSTDRVLLHVDEFSHNPLAVKMLMRACAHQSLQASPELRLKVIPVTTGVQSVLAMDALPQGTRYSVVYVYLAPLAEKTASSS